MADPLDTTSEVARATQEVAKATGKAIDAGRDLGSFVGRFVGEPLEHVSGMVSDRLAYMRLERQVRLMQRVERLQEESGITVIKPLPMKLAIPLFQGASLEENDDLQDRWAALLVNATNPASSIQLSRAVISILEELSSFDALVLDKIYEIPYAESKVVGVWTALLPDRVVAGTNDANGPVEVQGLEPTDDVVLSLANLKRLGCLTSDSFFDGGEAYGRVMPTLMGKTFVQACRAKTR
ncbi:Abi-alpha family protein [Cupriavidus sp. SW-Y-13]|uniref:Abi-alpha family protein n=1 Tax=Cupriavidus sp. SW-Y-13 TaxID=2653854 RepID=UPI001365D877|nr:Abi-alpha family protein [Cupriavidus sp. SW-Y-13]MWL87175.1 DUF4393 domain-containing protein [Cupriavidus sp. SW-Y-13]